MTLVQWLSLFVAALLTTTLSNHMPGAGPSEKLAYAAAAVALLVLGIGFVVSFWLPTPRSPARDPKDEPFSMQAR